uniref:Uncharacterized protein n=1 Tax=viral metagenome TaxID=1070528 RepID=A0A6M3LP90_9ZZZZ
MAIEQLEKESSKSEKNIAHYFKPVDKGSSMPSWYYRSQVEEELEWVKRAERQLKDDLIPQENKLTVKTELKAKKQRLKEISDARNEVEDKILAKGVNKDKAWARHKELGELIAESMFTRDEMFHRDPHGKKHRVIDPREEADRTPFRNKLIKEYKILGRILGENSNPERLRKGR